MNKIKKLLISLTAAALAATNVIGLASCFGDNGGSKVNTGDVEVRSEERRVGKEC